MTGPAGTSAMWGDVLVEREVHGHVVRVYEPRPHSIVDVLDTALRHDPDRVVLVQGDRRTTVAELARRSTIAASDLTIQPGDRVLLLARSSPDWVAWLFGILRAGGVPVLANGWWVAADVAHAVATTRPVVAVVDAEGAAKIPEDLEVRAVEIEAARDAVEDLPGPTAGEDDPGIILFTSGTTSQPRAAQLAHRSVLANLHNLIVRTGQLPGTPPRRQAVHLCSLPLFHISGLQTVLLNLLTGGRLVFLRGRFDAAEVLQLIEAEGVTSWAAIPTMVDLVLAHPDLAWRDTASLTSLAVGGAPVAPDLRGRVEDAFPSTRGRTGESYGSTEAGGTVATTNRDPASGTVGPRPFDAIDVDIADPGPDGSGEILVRSAALMDGYLDVAPDDQPIDRRGWLHTGDLGRIDEHGILHITGRAKEMIIRGGENIAPPYVEAALRAHPAVLDVAVLGVPHPTLGEEVGAVVRTVDSEATTTDELAEHAMQHLARFAIPTRWILTTEPIPLTDTGKVRRRDLVGWFG